MRKSQLLKPFVFALSTSLLFTACKKETTEVTLQQNQTLSLISGQMDINPDALRYYKNIETLIFATQSNIYSTLPSDEIDYDATMSNLKSLYIIDEDNDNRERSFFDMSENEQRDFIGQWSIEQAKSMSEKFALDVQLVDYVQSIRYNVKSIVSDQCQIFIYNL